MPRYIISIKQLTIAISRERTFNHWRLQVVKIWKNSRNVLNKIGKIVDFEICSRELNKWITRINKVNSRDKMQAIVGTTTPSVTGGKRAEWNGVGVEVGG